MVIGTTSELDFLESIGFCDTFSVTYHIPTLNTKYAKKVNIFILYIVVLFASWVIACY